MKRVRITRLTLLSCLLLVSMLAAWALAACGGGTSDSTSSPGASSAEPIKVGVPVPLSGYLAGDGLSSYQGISMAVDEINAKGGLLGRPLKIVKFDIQDMAPERLMQAADTLVAQDKVDVVQTGWAGAGADVQAFGKYQVPFFMSDASQAAVDLMKKNGYTNIWQTADTEVPFATSTWEFISSLPYEFPNKKLAIIESQDPLGTIDAATIKSLAEKEGWTVVLNQQVPYGTTNYTPILTKLRAQQPALIHFNVPSATDEISFVKGFLQNPSMSIVSLGYGLTGAEFLASMGKQADGLVGMGCYGQAFPTTPASQTAADWMADYTQKYGKGPAGISVVCYASTMIWAQAVEAVGDASDYAAVNKYLGANEFLVWDGILPYRFNADHLWSAVDLPWAWGQVKDKVVTTIRYQDKVYVDYQGKTHDFVVPPWLQGN